MNMKIPLKGNLISTIEAAMVAKIMDTGSIASNGLTKTLERELAAEHNYAFARCVSTGHAALTMALRIIKRSIATTPDDPNPKVALPIIAPMSTLSAVLSAGFQPIYIDVTSDCRANMLYDHIPGSAHVIVPVHSFGRAIDNKAGAHVSGSPIHPGYVIEDARQSMYVKGIGFGDICCISLDGMGIVNGGMGGVIMSNDRTVIQLVDDMIRKRDVVYSELNAALAYAQHLNRDVLMEAYQTVGNTLIASLEHIKWIECPPSDNNTFTTFPIVIDQNQVDPKVVNKDKIIAALNDNDIDARRIIPLANTLPETFPHANYVYEMGVRIPCHPMMTEENIGRIVETLEQIDGSN